MLQELRCENLSRSDAVGARKRTPSMGVASLLLALAGFSISAIGPKQAIAADNVNVLVTAGGFYTVPLTAMMQDFAAKYDLKITRSVVTGGGASAQMFGGGTGDIMTGGLEGPLRLAQTKIEDVTVIGETLRASPWVLVAKAGSPIKSLADLKGKRVGITGFGALSESELKYHLKKAGMSIKDVEMVALGNGPSQLAALQRGNADAVLQGSPYLARLLKNNEVQVVFDYGETYWANNVITARTKAIKENPGLYARFMQAYREALHRLVTDHDYATKVATETWGTSISPEDIQIELKDYTDRYWQPEATFTREQFELAKDIMLESPNITKEGLPTFEDLTRNSPK